MTADRHVLALGAMSGTSLDGVDAAMVETDGETIRGFGPSAYRPYRPAERAALRAALGLWPGDDPGRLAAAAKVVEEAHVELLSGFEGAALIGFHGQTLAHEPHGRGTHQLGDGAALARALGVPVVWDFRSADVALGGQGAPLTPFFHFACARLIGARKPVVFVNLGGVANLTWVDPSRPSPEAEGALLAFDTGPANAPLDDLLLARRGRALDRDGRLAARGQVDEDVVAAALAHPYLARIPPKSLDRDSFAHLPAALERHDDADAAATLTAVAAAMLAAGLRHCPAPPARILVSGGGRRNPVLMKMIARYAEMPVATVETVGLDGDMLEAQAFAYLAVRVTRGLPTSCPGTTGVAGAVGGGLVSRPGD